MPTSLSAAVRQLSDANSQGTVLGQSPTDKIGFYSSSTSQPVVQPSYSTLGVPLSGGNLNVTSGSAIIKYQVSLVTNSVAATTTVEQTSFVGYTSTSIFGVDTSSVIMVNKSTATAGLGVAGARVASSGAIALTYMNESSAAQNIPVQVYDVVEIKAGPLTTTAVLSPAAVAATSQVEQIFNIAGNACYPGTIGIVNKPTQQAGLGYNQFCRVVGVNQVGITFYNNNSTAALTPTASETYQFAFLPQLNAFNPTLIYMVPQGQAATNASSVTWETTAATGVVTTDVVSGIAVALSSAALSSTSTFGAYVTSAGVIQVGYQTVLGAQTPPPSQTLAITLQRQTPLNPAMLYSTTLAGTTCAATTTVESTTAVTGILASSSIAVMPSAPLPAGIAIVNARVTSAGAIGVQYANLTTTSIVVPALAVTLANIQMQGPGAGVLLGSTAGAGCAVVQSYFPAVQQSATIASALRTALVNLGLVASN